MRTIFYLPILFLTIIISQCKQQSEKTVVNHIDTTKRIHADGYILENADIRAVFSKETGALLELTDKTSQWQFQKHAELGISFQLLAPLPEKRNNAVFGNKQKKFIRGNKSTSIRLKTNCVANTKIL